MASISWPEDAQSGPDLTHLDEAKGVAFSKEDRADEKDNAVPSMCMNNDKTQVADDELYPEIHVV